MDMELSRKEGETHIVDMCENMSLFERSSQMERAQISSLYITKSKTGQSLLIVRFDNGTVWMPKWDDEIHFLWCYAFLTELTNLLNKELDPTKPKKYNPQKNLIEPLLDFINKEIGIWELKLVHSPINEGIQLVKSQSRR